MKASGDQLRELAPRPDDGALAQAADCTWRQLPPLFGPARPTVYRRFAE
jgi:hypothetical protein